eukprot:CAMPEP_0170486710 /NCGR_PEP_ID=MMETSP0208-20121228/5658_1 /TAXON_ID=197538 /ORGANISM="Strombidium inclinatum, Strain S3" /LENGTH=106 /DNA_ID=CAMNT_0010760729 /DNA_START=530 /DNA_END=850 /DNA_ORIENTATION=+
MPFMDASYSNYYNLFMCSGRSFLRESVDIEGGGEPLSGRAPDSSMRPTSFKAAMTNEMKLKKTMKSPMYISQLAHLLALYLCLRNFTSAGFFSKALEDTDDEDGYS